MSQLFEDEGRVDALRERFSGRWEEAQERARRQLARLRPALALHYRLQESGVDSSQGHDLTPDLA